MPEKMPQNGKRQRRPQQKLWWGRIWSWTHSADAAGAAGPNDLAIGAAFLGPQPGNW